MPKLEYNLAWMLTSSRGVTSVTMPRPRTCSPAAAEQGMVQAQNMLAKMGTPRGAPPACLRPPESDPLVAAAPRSCRRRARQCR